MPSRFILRAGMAASLTSTLAFFWLARSTHGWLPAPLCWTAFGLSALAAIGCALRLLLQLPLIEASEFGIAIWLHGPYRRPFFAPWSRVRAVRLTHVRSASGVAARDALGIELNRDDRFPLPARSASDEVPVDDAAQADLAWSSRSISGDLRRWEAVLQQMRSAYGPPN
jgi:hypothetical protein